MCCALIRKLSDQERWIYLPGSRLSGDPENANCDDEWIREFGNSPALIRLREQGFEATLYPLLKIDHTQKEFKYKFGTLSNIQTQNRPHTKRVQIWHTNAKSHGIKYWCFQNILLHGGAVKHLLFLVLPTHQLAMLHRSSENSVISAK